MAGALASLLFQGKKQKSTRHLEVSSPTPRPSSANRGLRAEASPGCAAADRGGAAWGGREAPDKGEMGTAEKAGSL